MNVSPANRPLNGREKFLRDEAEQLSGTCVEPPQCPRARCITCRGPCEGIFGPQPEPEPAYREPRQLSLFDDLIAGR